MMFSRDPNELNQLIPKGEEIASGDEHLSYLLTAYLFDNISDEGRREVDRHLAECDACRGELLELEETLLEVEETLPTGGDDEVYEVNEEVIPKRGTPVTVTIKAVEKDDAEGVGGNPENVEPEETGKSD